MTLPLHTLTQLTKTGNEVLIYANLDTGIVKKKLYRGGEVVVTSCAGSTTCPAGSFDATILTTPSKAAFGAFPVNSPAYTAKAGSISPTEDGVLADLACLPNPANDFLICFDKSFSAQSGQQFRPIPRKFNPSDHQVMQRPENTISLADYYVNNYTGLRSLNGRECTIIAKIYPQGGGAVQETIYFCGVKLSVPLLSYGDDQNASIETSASGTYGFAAVFSGDPS